MIKIATVIAFLLLAVQLKSIGQKQPVPIRGTWITNTASDAMKSKKNIRQAIQLCKESGINNVFVVVWNNGETMYPSKVVEEYVGIKQSAVYGAMDPIKEFVKEGHKAGIKVHAWFEFGFSMLMKTAILPG